MVEHYPVATNTEEYDGSSWSSGGDLSQQEGVFAAGGIQTAAGLFWRKIYILTSYIQQKNMMELLDKWWNYGYKLEDIFNWRRNGNKQLML